MSIPTQIAETIQTAHINRSPSPQHDINPSTSASIREPVRVSSSSYPDPGHDDHHLGQPDAESIADDESDIPISVLRPQRRRQVFPPMPDLRFEQSYLHSIENAESWGHIAWITFRDQIVMPLAQGVLYSLAICGWQYWNKTAQYSGSSAGARIRRWWYEVNNWHIPVKSKRA